MCLILIHIHYPKPWELHVSLWQLVKWPKVKGHLNLFLVVLHTSSMYYSKYIVEIMVLCSINKPISEEQHPCSPMDAL